MDFKEMFGMFGAIASGEVTGLPPKEEIECAIGNILGMMSNESTDEDDDEDEDDDDCEVSDDD